MRMVKSGQWKTGVLVVAMMWSPSLVVAQGSPTPASQAQAGGVVGKVSFLKGTLQRSLAANSPSEDMRRGQDVREGDIIKTGPASRAELRMGDGSALRLGQNSQIVVGKISGPLGGLPAEVEVSAGSLWATITKAAGGEKRFAVKTNSAVAGVRGTVFQTTVGPDGTTYVVVHEGAVLVDNSPILAKLAGGGGATKQETLQPGFGVAIDASGNLVGPLPVAQIMDMMIQRAGLEADFFNWNQAQDAAPPSTEAQGATPTEGEAAAPKENTANLKVGDDVNRLSPPQMVNRSDQMLQEMNASLRNALDLISAARREKDIVRLNCLNERVTQMKGVLKVATDAHVALQEQAATGDTESARVSYTKVALGRDRVATLRVQAQNCVGAESYYGGDTEVVTTINPNLAGGDPFFGDRGPGLPPPQADFADQRPGVDNTSPDTPTPPPPTSSFGGSGEVGAGG